MAFAAGAVSAAWAPLAGAATPAGEGLQVNISGKLADYDNRPLQGARAGAAILVSDVGGPGIASIKVFVDRKRVDTHRVACRPSCPDWATHQFTYERSRFGGGRHVVTTVAVDAKGHSVRQKINLPRRPSVAQGQSKQARPVFLPSGNANPSLLRRAAHHSTGVEHSVLGALKGAISGTPSGPPHPQPAYYVTAKTPTDLKRQLATDAARFASTQGPGPALMMFDFGAVRRKGSRYGASLRSGAFFSNDEIAAALNAAASAYAANYQQGTVTIVYGTSNSHIGDPKHGFTPLNVKTAYEAGRRQTETLRHLHLYDNESAAVGGDIEPGYPNKVRPKVSIALVRGASAGRGNPYYNVGTAPCDGNNCKNGWTVRDVCKITNGGGRLAVPEIYFATPDDQSKQWAMVRRKCGIQAFAGASADRLGHYEPTQSWQLLRKRGKVGVGPVIVVWPE